MRSLAAHLPLLVGAIGVGASFASGCAVADNDGMGTPDAFPTRTDGGGGIPDAGPPMADAGSSACAQSLASLRFDFEGSAQGFVHNLMPEVASSGVNWTFDHWEQGPSPQTSCISGSDCWGTNLDDNYIQCQRAYLVSAPMDLSDCGVAGQDVQLLFQHNYDFWTGDFGGSTWFDGGLVEISADGSNWQSAGLSYPGTIDINPDMGGSFACVEKNNFYVDGKSGFVGSSGGWISESLTIPASMASVTFQIRFVYASGVSSQTTDQGESMLGTAPGWFIDDLRLQ